MSIMKLPDATITGFERFSAAKYFIGGRTCGMLILSAVLSSGIMPSFSAYQPIRNDYRWRDISGKQLLAQGGCVRKFGSTYYWYGSFFDSLPNRGDVQSIVCYSSTDLSHWKYENVVLWNQSNRADALYNASTKQYVLFLKSETVGYATCSTPTGDFTFKNTEVIGSNTGGGDLSVFQDDDGKGYVVYTGWENNGQNNAQEIAELKPDYLSVARKVVSISTPENYREAPFIFKRRGVYYWFMSEAVCWETSPTHYMTATNLAGPWTPDSLLQTSPRSNDSYNTQHDFEITVAGSTDTTIIFCGDNWVNIPDSLSTCGETYGRGLYYWAPIAFSGKKTVVRGQPGWYIDVATGAWTAALTPPDPEQYEAENMTLTNYTVQSDSFAYGGRRVVVSSGTGSASCTYQGSSGLKNITVFYFDTLGGNAAFSLSIGGSPVKSWTANDFWGLFPWTDPSIHAQSHTGQEFRGVKINQGDQIKLDGTANGTDLAALDMVLIKSSDGSTRSIRAAASDAHRTGAMHAGCTIGFNQARDGAILTPNATVFSITGKTVRAAGRPMMPDGVYIMRAQSAKLPRR